MNCFQENHQRYIERFNFLLQPLDVSLNKLFKDGVRKQWMADGIHEFTVRRFRKRGMPFHQK